MCIEITCCGPIDLVVQLIYYIGKIVFFRLALAIVCLNMDLNGLLAVMRGSSSAVLFSFVLSPLPVVMTLVGVQLMENYTKPVT